VENPPPVKLPLWKRVIAWLSALADGSWKKKFAWIGGLSSLLLNVYFIWAMVIPAPVAGTIKTLLIFLKGFFNG
jgi:hypothetical protein